MKLVAAKCPNCGADIEVDKNNNSTKCEYCNKRIIIDDAIAKYKIEVSGSVEVANLTNFNKLVKLADNYLEDEKYDQALDKYDKAIELEPDDAYVAYRIAFINFLNDKTNRSNLMYTLKRIICIDNSPKDDYKKTRSFLIKELAETVYLEAAVCHKSLEKDNISAVFLQNNLFLMNDYLFFLEKLHEVEISDDDSIEALIVYILDVIKYVSGGYYYNNCGKSYLYQDTSHLSLFRKKKDKYYNELIDINSDYVGKADYKIKRKPVLLYNFILRPLAKISKYIIIIGIFFIILFLISLIANN